MGKKQRLLLALSASLLLMQSALAKQPDGIFGLLQSNKAAPVGLLDQSFVDGVSIRVLWSELEPVQGKYDWAYLDHELAEVKKKGKVATLRIMSGSNCPDWLYKADVPHISFKDEDPHHKRSFGKVMKMPVVWDSAYLSAWTRFVTAFAKRYSTRKEVVLVHLSGPTWRTAEMYLPRKGDAPDLLIKAGYTPDRLVDAWQTVIDHFAKCFPSTPLALNADVPLKEDGVLERVIDYAIKKLGERLCVQGNWLSAHTPTKYSRHAFRKMVELHNSRGVKIGFQMLGSAEFRSEQQGPLNRAIAIGERAGGSYFEIYPTDLLDKKNLPLLTAFHKRLK